MTTPIRTALALSALLVFCPHPAPAQDNPPVAQDNPADNDPDPQQPGTAPQPVQKAANVVQDTVKKYHIGVSAGVGLDPELIDVSGYGYWGLFRSLDLRPGLELGFGELTTLFGINVDVLYTFPGFSREARWVPYVGGGPNFTLSHEEISAAQELDIQPTVTTTTTVTTANGTTATQTSTNRFDFSNTKWQTGANFILGARNRRGMFLEMRATAYGVQIVRVVAGFGF